ncbi:Outer membrane lipoprotein-sorting protein [Halovenus aranensis]|uniref:Outer membrane lipoprotein-sorting protein n=1 Tax=Halovenus aranensis TaxID=890420 RepID=A0A1G8W3B1_9EURY|nr:DUF4367 domain-containing protein [Halovenus aranensis]SDJ72864.1 Outer membrane lipoprotein-sorting protein [Halovenus aranensis]
MFGSRRTHLAFLCLVVLCFLGGCTTILSDDVTESDLIDEAENAEPPAGLSATIEFNATFEDEQVQYSYDVWYRNDGLSRLEGTTDAGEFVQVDDGEQIWSYTAGEETVRVREDPTNRIHLRDSINATEELLRERNVTEITETEYQGRAVYHVVIGGQAEQNDGNGNGILPPLFPSAGGILGGGTQTDKSTGNDTTAGTRRMELWIDTEYMYILRQKVEGKDPFELRYTDVTFEPGIDDDRFEFEVPEGATVKEVATPQYQEFDSIAALSKESPVDIEEPSFETLDATFDSAYLITREESDEVRVGLQYNVGQTTPLSVSKDTNTTELSTEGERVQIGGVTGVYETVSEGSHQLTWVADGAQYRVFASLQTDRETLIQIAESMGTT